MSKVLQMCFDTSTGEMLYCGTNEHSVQEAYTRAHPHGFYVAYIKSYTAEEAEASDTIPTTVMNNQIRGVIGQKIKEQLKKRLRKEGFDD